MYLGSEAAADLFSILMSFSTIYCWSYCDSRLCCVVFVRIISNLFLRVLYSIRFYFCYSNSLQCILEMYFANTGIIYLSNNLCTYLSRFAHWKLLMHLNVTIGCITHHRAGNDRVLVLFYRTKPTRSFEH